MKNNSLTRENHAQQRECRIEVQRQAIDSWKAEEDKWTAASTVKMARRYREKEKEQEIKEDKEEERRSSSSCRCRF
ncbi:hypothetical protein SLA2020_351900 [Shorea laevis]